MRAAADAGAWLVTIMGAALHLPAGDQARCPHIKWFRNVWALSLRPRKPARALEPKNAEFLERYHLSVHPQILRSIWEGRGGLKNLLGTAETNCLSLKAFAAATMGGQKQMETTFSGVSAPTAGWYST